MILQTLLPVENGKMAVLDTVPVISLKSTRWLYRGEGNANLVITIPDEKVIIRMEKCDYHMKISSEIIEMREKKVKRGVEFHMKIIMPFLGKAFIQPPLLGRLRQEEIAELDLELFEKRPEFRLAKGIRYELVTVHPDYTYLPPVLINNAIEKPLNGSSGSKKWTKMHNCFPQIGFLSYLPNQIKNYKSNEPTYCIEIKPKQGWVYPADRHHPKCTYCLNQFVKFKKKRISRKSEYCPLDLFSGNLSRMKKAIRNLIITPQNNLKIFKNGDVVYSDETKRNISEILSEWLEPQNKNNSFNEERLLDKWVSLVAEALMKQLTEEPAFDLTLINNKTESKNYNKNASPLRGIIEPCDWSPSILPNNCILNRILMMQKLQELDFASLYDIYCNKKSTEGDYDYVDRLLYYSEPPGDIERYLLSTTAKDCSIFIAFQHTMFKSDNSLHSIQDYDGTMYWMNVGISDIDPKPLSCIEKHFKRDKDVVEAVFKYIEQTG